MAHDNPNTSSHSECDLPQTYTDQQTINNSNMPPLIPRLGLQSWNPLRFWSQAHKDISETQANATGEDSLLSESALPARSANAKQLFAPEQQTLDDNMNSEHISAESGASLSSSATSPSRRNSDGTVLSLAATDTTMSDLPHMDAQAATDEAEIVRDIIARLGKKTASVSQEDESAPAPVSTAATASDQHGQLIELDRLSTSTTATNHVGEGKEEGDVPSSAPVMSCVTENVTVAVASTPPTMPVDGEDQTIKEEEPRAPSLTTSPYQELAVVDPRISALSGRGIKVPVKQKGGVKRPAPSSPEPEEADHSEEDGSEHPAAAEHPPTKKSKPNSTSKPAVRPAKKSRKITTAKRPRTEPSKEADTNVFEAVIAGTQLPRTAGDAKAAAKARYKRLVEHQQKTEKNSSKQSRAERARKKTSKPDLMPEFFDKANFAKGQEDDSVRCVCGATADDGEHMVACDGCAVWQHTECMGDTVQKGPDGDKYLCHVCDPFVHRETIAKLRRENGL